MIILLSLSISGGSELCFDNLVKLRAADLKKSSPDPQKPAGPNPAGKGLSSIWAHTGSAFGSVLTVTGARLPTLDSLVPFSHRDRFLVDCVEVRTLAITPILGVSVAKSLALPGSQYPHWRSEDSTPSSQLLSSDISEPFWNLYSEILWLICTNQCFTKQKWLMMLWTLTIRPRELWSELQSSLTLFINQAVQILSYMALFLKAIDNGISELWNKYILQIPSLHSKLCGQSCLHISTSWVSLPRAFLLPFFALMLPIFSSSIRFTRLFYILLTKFFRARGFFFLLYFKFISVIKINGHSL